MRLSRLWASTGLLVLALALGTGPASAAASQGPAMVSTDAQHWAASLERPLFDQARHWAPGDTETVTVWVRKPVNGPADLQVITVDDDRWVRSGFVLTVRVDGKSVRVGDNVGRRVAGTAPSRVDITVTVPSSTVNSGQDLQPDLHLLVRLGQPGGPRHPSSSFDPTEPAGLSVPVAGRHVTTTGALPVSVPFTLAAIALVVRAALAGRRPHPRKDLSCPQP